MESIRVLGISLGSSNRDYAASVDIAGVNFQLERIGTEGKVEAAAELIRSYDGKVDAIGLGGVNLAYCLGKLAYPIREGVYLAEQAAKTPVVDGAFIKEEWETRLVQGRAEELRGKRVLVTSALDRYPLARELERVGARVWLGDALLALKIPVLFPSTTAFGVFAYPTMPLLSRLPLRYLYPLGKKQEEIKPRWDTLIKPMDVIAGDFHLLRRFLPRDLSGKVILTSTLTEVDQRELKDRGAKHLIPLGLTVKGRSFGANILEGMVIGAAKRRVFGTEDKVRTLQVLMEKQLES